MCIRCNVPIHASPAQLSTILRIRPLNPRLRPLLVLCTIGAPQEVIFYPKFHCELNFIERFWCGAKFYSREHRGYSFKSLRKVLPTALDSVSTVPNISLLLPQYAYSQCIQQWPIIWYKGVCGKVYKGHRQVVDGTKW